MEQLKIAILTFLACFVTIYGLTTQRREEKDEVKQRVWQYTIHRGSREEKPEEAEPQQPLFKRILMLFSLLMPKRLIKNVEADLVQADIPLKVEEMVGLNIALALLPAVITMLVLQNSLLALLLACLGAYLPRLLIKNAKAKRAQKFNDQLGDALQLMANSLRAGFSFLQAMDSISKEMTPPVSQEFARTLREMRLGTPTEEALQNLGTRVKSDDLDLVITAVVIQRQVGGNLAQILENISTTISERIRLQAEVKTLTAQGRISGTIVALLPVFLTIAISLMNPSYIMVLFTHPLGLVLIGGAVISEIIGIMAIKRIITIDF
ncbi:MAG: type II secretion system F family protein [Dethiobacteraceae bacterium]|jgi:tight adherence protein B|nr:secretion system protein [Bacillota bacterium]